LSDHIQKVNLQVWIPGQDLAVDEIMARFLGRVSEAIIIPGKPIPTGFKIWGIG